MQSLFHDCIMSSGKMIPGDNHMYLFKLPDELYIQRIRRSKRYHKWIGLSIIILSIILFFVLHHWINDSMALGVRMSMTNLLNNTAPIIQPTDPQVLELNSMVFSHGFMCGLAMQLMWFVGFFMATGIALLFPNRKNRMILQLWDQKQAATATYNHGHDTSTPQT
jgi:hypothetical protein